MRFTSLKAEISRNEEAVSNFKEHKEFLDRLAHKDWHDTKQKKYKEIINREKQIFVEKEFKKLENMGNLFNLDENEIINYLNKHTNNDKIQH